MVARGIDHISYGLGCRVRRECGNTVFRDYIGILFPFFPLTTSKLNPKLSSTALFQPIPPQDNTLAEPLNSTIPKWSFMGLSSDVEPGF